MLNIFYIQRVLFLCALVLHIADGPEGSSALSPHVTQSLVLRHLTHKRTYCVESLARTLDC
ncbi:MAG: hypothetical protein OXC30_04230 [Alphaproteobacteria bacterium]|nr:hypothetical protein [Alphaproteobacteria bacterium]